jgi:hypothetical protein
VALQLIYLVFAKLLSWIVLRTRSDTTKEIEIQIAPCNHRETPRRVKPPPRRVPDARSGWLRCQAQRCQGGAPCDDLVDQCVQGEDGVVAWREDAVVLELGDQIKGDLLADIGHLQLADNPGRHEPGTGEINYPWLLAQVAGSAYDGWVGCEYLPSRDTAASLAWARPFLQAE